VERRTFLEKGVSACLLTMGGRLHAEPVFTAEEFLLLPLRIHLLRATQAPALDCRLQEGDAARILGKVNTIWSQAGIRFRRESLRIEEAAGQELYQGLAANRTEGHLRLIRPRASLSPAVFHLYYLREMGPNGICLNASHEMLFVKDTARLFPVEGGIDEPLPRVSAHEIGHALGLDHRQDRFNLMASGTTGTSLNAAEVATSRSKATGFSFVLAAPKALELARQQVAESQPDRGLLEALAGLPGGELVREARRLLDGLGKAVGG